ncbi:glucose-1-phosphate cytidylyltransferase [Parasedimentitalea maritima]|uniref:Glucose-1-phosphate cytidylyltransferase n=1 Tax=Parasedimentitalea maritima TaxID=2578117 RepID=A0ABY2USB5_9RHOB|nr:glucose-1-phosphate cytidylyltransferase [Zongyanglinia marina]TLP60301.1 glucose-1-phosphate cytidylyltransferase [Zongyanglinia marina]
MHPDSRSVRKAVILAGGLGTRLSEETSLRPKPMVEIGGRPVLWHIMNMYAHHGVTEFIICLGYKGYMIKEFFLNYFLHTSDITVDLGSGETTVHQKRAAPWKVTLVETGDATLTGGRIKAVADFVGAEHFCMTYGDGVSDINISALLDYHSSHDRDATVSIVRPSGRFGMTELGDEDEVVDFREKLEGETGWINGGFFVLSPSVFERIEGPETTWEQEPMRGLAEDGQLKAFKHEGYWQAMDTLREKNMLEELWSTGRAPWKVWA